MWTTISEVRADGLLLTVQDKGEKCGEQTVWMPAAEWSESAEDWARHWFHLSPEFPLRVVPLDGRISPDGLLEVSQRRVAQDAERKEWLRRCVDFTVDSLGKTLVRGSVQGVPAVMTLEQYHAGIRIDRLPAHLQDHAALGRGDVLTCFVASSQPNGELRVDPEQHMEILRQELASVEGGAVTPESGALLEVSQIAVEFSDLAKTQLKTVLLIENDAFCRQAIHCLLDHLGVNVVSIQDLQQARDYLDASVEQCERNGSVLAIVDPNLSKTGDDLKGLEVARELAQRPGHRILILTGEARHQHKLMSWRDIVINGFMEKPFTAQQLVHGIEESLQLAPAPLADFVRQIDCQRDDKPEVRAADECKNGEREYAPMSVQEALRHLGNARPGTVLNVFQIHPRSHRAQSLASWGGGLNWFPLRGKVAKSPIGDVALRGEPLFEKPSDSYGRHLWTSRMIDYKIFFGIPISLPGPFCYALVGFHNDEEAFDDSFRVRAELCAARVGRCLDRDTLLSQRSSEVDMATTGLAFQCLAHEVYTNMVSLASSLALGAMIASDGKAPVDADLSGPNLLLRSRRIVELLVNKTNVLRGTRVKQERVNVGEALQRAAIGCRFVLRDVVRHRDSIDIVLPEDDALKSYHVISTPAGLAMLFFNLYLNAAQQIDSMASVRHAGRVWHSWDRRTDQNGHEWLCVRIHDSGPGIHANDAERIFAPGFSTRPQGTGLGLYLCRLLARGIQHEGRQGDVTLVRSSLWDGSVFAGILPLS